MDNLLNMAVPTVTTAGHKVYECGICDSLHPWDWNGDCREDAARFAGVDDYAERMGISESAVEVVNWEERQAADDN